MSGTIGQIGKIAGVGRYASLAGSGMHMKLSEDVKRIIASILAHGDDRAAFNAILLATVEHVSKKPNFNVQLEMNDLWIKLTNLRDDIGKAPAGSPSGGFGGSAGLGGPGGIGAAIGSTSGVPLGIQSVLGNVLKALESRTR